MAQERATSHIVGSLYDYSEAAGHEIVSLFKENSNPDTRCHFNDGNYFTIHATHNNDESLAYLVKSIRKLISVEKNKEPDLFEDEKIIRKGGTHSSLTLAAVIEKRMQAIKPDGQISLIEHENIIRKWSPSSEIRELGSKLNLQLLGRIGNLCGCRIEQASDSADVLIKADREQDIEKGVSKLEQLNKMMVDELSFPRFHSFFILEGEISVDLQLIALKDLDDKRLVTTLLQKESSVKVLGSLCVLTFVKGFDIVHVKLMPAISNQRSSLWKDHGYRCGQAQDLIAAKTPKEPETLINKWITEVNERDVQMDAFLPESAVELQQSLDVVTVSKEPLSPTKKPITKRARTARGNLDAFNKALAESVTGHNGSKETSQEKPASFSGHQRTERISTGEETQSHRQPPSIEPPYMPSHAIPLTATPSCSLPKTPSTALQQVMPISSTWDNVVVRGSKSGSLIDMSVPNEGRAQGNKTKDEATVVIEKLQDPTKAKARDIKYTMKQKKAPTQAFMGGNTALIKSFEESTVQLLALALPRTGRIGFAVNIGRLLINQQRGSPEFKNKSFKTSEFSSVLPRGRTTGFEPIFTNMLTAHSSEAESIVNVLLSQGRRLFHQQPIFRKVTYVFSCKAKGGDHIFVELDDNGEFNIQGSEVLMGTLDWHFPKRAWDARLQLTSERFLATDYRRQVNGIVDNLKISVSRCGQLFELWTKTIDENLSIESITLRRETLHPATIYPDLILHVTECQDLQVRQPSNFESIYSGSIQAPDVMIKANRLWWEAKISSTSATTILKENATLELGETATWSTSSIVNKGVVRDLFATTKEIVTQIDHVGFFNNGRGSSCSKTATTEKPSENAANLRTVDPAFW